MRYGEVRKSQSPWSQVTSLLKNQSFKSYVLYPMPSALRFIIFYRKDRDTLMISNALAELSVFKHFNVEEGVINASSDGQKFETQISTINARHSPEYFGLKKGVTSYTLVANNVPVNARII